MAQADLFAPDSSPRAQEPQQPHGAAPSLAGRTIAILTADEGVERVEYEQPRAALERAGATVVLASPGGEQVVLYDHMDRAGSVAAETSVGDLDPSSVDGYLLPGGVANPDQLRLDDDAVRLLRGALEAGKPVAVICHGPWTLIETGGLDGRVITSWPSLRTDLTNAGADWVDREVVTCDHGPGLLVSSRKPDDLDAFCAASVAAFASSEVRAGSS